MKTKSRTRRATAPLPSIAVIGPGNWGTSLVHGLHKAGIPLSEVVASRSRSIREMPPAIPIIMLNRAVLDASVLWLCVPDSAIAEVTRRIVQRLAKRPAQLKGRIVVHSSGALNASVLGAAARAGASIASVHPVMTFPTRVAVQLSEVPFGIEADAFARPKLNAIIRRLGGVPFTLSSSGKALYHAAGMLASPLLVSLMTAAQQMAELAGLSSPQAKRVIEPIARASLANVFSKGKANSFSGPIARGDLASIHLHLEALSQHPILAEVYRSLALYALDALPARNTRAIRRVLKREMPEQKRARGTAKDKIFRDVPAAVFDPVRN
jgi:predicted short-subunit dehydrogenase-like oxidoreductase (DUF2520 family)